MNEWALVALVFGLALLAFVLILWAGLGMIEEDDERMRAAIPGWDEMRRLRREPPFSRFCDRRCALIWDDGAIRHSDACMRRETAFAMAASEAEREEYARCRADELLAAP